MPILLSDITLGTHLSWKQSVPCCSLSQRNIYVSTFSIFSPRTVLSQVQGDFLGLKTLVGEPRPLQGSLGDSSLRKRLYLSAMLNHLELKKKYLGLKPSMPRPSNAIAQVSRLSMRQAFFSSLFANFEASKSKGCLIYRE